MLCTSTACLPTWLTKPSSLTPSMSPPTLVKPWWASWHFWRICWRFRLGLWLRLTGHCVDQEGEDVELKVGASCCALRGPAQGLLPFNSFLRKQPLCELVKVDLALDLSWAQLHFLSVAALVNPWHGRPKDPGLFPYMVVSWSFHQNNIEPQSGFVCGMGLGMGWGMFRGWNSYLVLLKWACKPIIPAIEM